MLLEVTNLSGGYGSNDICKGISCQVDKGEILSVVGPNGCGKTTFFRLMLGFLKASGGDIRIDGRSLLNLSRSESAQLIAYIPQHHTPIFSYTVLDVILMGRASHFSIFSSPRQIDRNAAFAALERMKISHLANRPYTLLSGGQRQMVLIARAICQDARVFIMDEPGASLDYANHQLLMELIIDLARQGYAIVLSTHSPEHPFSVAHKVLLMSEGKVAAFGPPQTAITSHVLESVYGIEMDVVTVQDRYGLSHTLCLPVRQP